MCHPLARQQGTSAEPKRRTTDQLLSIHKYVAASFDNIVKQVLKFQDESAMSVSKVDTRMPWRVAPKRP